MEEKIIVKSMLKDIKAISTIFIKIGAVLTVICEIIVLCIANSNYDKYWDDNLIDFAFSWYSTELFIGLIPLVLSVIAAIIFYYAFYKTELTVTDKRVFGCTKFGKRVDLPLDSVSALALSPLNGVAVTTASGAIKFILIKNSTDIHYNISRLLVERQKKENNTEKYAVSDAEELKKFKELLDIGVITQEEFEAKKKELLGF